MLSMQVDPVPTIAPYLGGKRFLAGRLARRIAAIPHEVYAEPFLGAGGVFLRRTHVPRTEIVNDINRELVTFLRCLQRHYGPLLEELRFRVQARAEFERLKASDPATLTDLERAARFFYLQRTAFGGKVRGQTFGVSPGDGGSRFDMRDLEQVLAKIHRRLAGVIIECLDWREFLARYDRPETLFYLDPPYHGHEADYGAEVFARADFAEMAERLAALRGRFLLSINDTPEVREIFGAFRLEAVQTTYTVGSKDAGEGKAVGELIVSDR